jgi:CBS domain-containing protein
MIIKEAMGPPALTVRSDVCVRRVAEAMRRHDLGSLPVVDAEKVVGFVTDRDLAVRALAAGKDPDATSVGQVMTPGFIHVEEDVEVLEAVETMKHAGVRRLMVVNHQGRLCGIVTPQTLAASDAPDRLVADLLRATKRPGCSGE